MKTYSLGLYEKAMPSSLTWREKLQTAKQSGYDFLEISIDETDEKLSRLDMNQEERAGLQSIMNGIGMPIRTMCLSGHRRYPLGSTDPAISRRGMEIIEKSIALAEDIGIRIIQLAGYDVYYEESSPQTTERFILNLKVATEMAAKAGVVLGFETMETEFMNTVEKAMHYVSLVNSSYLNVYPDIGNITNAALTYGTDVLQDLEAGNGHLVAMHLKETLPGKFREIPYGTGHVDFEAAINKAWELGVRKYVTEFWYTGKEDWRNELSSACEMMTELLLKKSRGRRVA